MTRPPMLPLLSILAVAGCFYVSEQERKERWDRDDDGVERPADCDDGDPNLTSESTFYADGDGDGYGDAAQPMVGCAPPNGFVADRTDCDDTDPQTYPGATERCDGSDNNCDNDIDEGISQVEWFPDSDGDGFGEDGAAVRACDRPDGHVAAAGDCDDSDPDINPDADEVCNGIDDDCAGGVDEADPNVILTAWFHDVDGDGFGDDTTQVDTCDAPGMDFVQQGGDCGPSDPEINPAADELCNGRDDDCDLDIDVDAVDATRYYVDADEDGFGDISMPADLCPDAQDSGDTGLLGACDLAPQGYSCSPSDCADNDPARNPDADEICVNGVDDNCNSQTDESPCI